MPFIKPGVDQDRHTSPGAVFLFQKVGVFLWRGIVLELQINPVFSSLNTASGLQYLVNFCLRDRKSGGFFVLRLLNDILLFFDGREKG
ncbi:hypothetical protein [Ruminiclostridium cellobioparum]|uniref:hypothetical protein n=1 Tax=Ruminiclostridium cellobioparum TaxID=29355 RepID=UPI0028ACC1E8|nr:hypothetical protein [Ruminiclostridium cellobioparum]